jgi:ribosomal protein L21
MDYAVCQISGRQYIIKPGSIVEVDKLEDGKFTVDKVLMIVNGGNIQMGDPYLKTTLDFEVVAQKREKIRVAKFKSKANYRKVHGTVRQTTQIKLVEKAAAKSKKEEGES